MPKPHIYAYLHTNYSKYTFICCWKSCIHRAVHNQRIITAAQLKIIYKSLREAYPNHTLINIHLIIVNRDAHQIYINATLRLCGWVRTRGFAPRDEAERPKGQMATKHPYSAQNRRQWQARPCPRLGVCWL